MRIIGSQHRELLKDSGYVLVGRRLHNPEGMRLRRLLLGAAPQDTKKIIAFPAPPQEAA